MPPPRCIRRCVAGDAAVLRASASAIRRASTASAARRARDSRPRASRSRDFLRVGKEEIVFTSGGTESDNMAIKGVAMGRAAWAPHHVEDRAPRGAAGGAEPRDPGLRRRPISTVDGDGLVDPDGGPAGHPARHDPDLDHARQLRDRDHPARAGDRRDRPRARDPVPRGRGADLREGADRSRRLRHRHAVLLRPQDLRAEGRGGALHPERHQDGLRPARRRARAAPSRGHRERDGHRRARPGGRDPRPGHGGRGRPADRAARSPVGRHPRPGARRAAERPSDPSGCPAPAISAIGTWSRNPSCSAWI